MIHKISASESRLVCDPKQFNNLDSTKSDEQGLLIGQERAVRALRFGIDIRDKGFNIYVAGLPGTGRTTAIERFLQEVAVGKPVPMDWCYVHNFDDNYRPRALRLPAGRARELQKDVDGFVKSATRSIREAFEGEQYAAQQENTLKSFQEQKEQIIAKMGEFARQNGFGLQATPMGIFPVPMKNGEPLTEKDFGELSEKERADLKQTEEKIQESIETVMRQTRALDNSAREAQEQLDQQVFHFVLDHLIAALLEKYQQLPDVLSHLNAVENNILENIAQYKPEVADKEKPVPDLKRNPTDKYRINVVVDNSKLEGAPVVVEMNPTYGNLFGRIEQEAFMGALVTNFTLIRGGSLQRANGGYLVLPAEDVIRNPFTWESLKRCLRNNEIAIEEPFEQPVFTAKSLRPEPIPLDVKVILIGRADIYQLLLAYDDHFTELFKVKADFDTQMDRTAEHIQDYANFVAAFCKSQNLTNLDPSGLARLVEYGSRLAEDQSKLSTRFGEIANVLREANYYAVQSKADLITSGHIERAIEERLYRSSLTQDRLREMISKDMIKIDLSSQTVGQVNGLSVLQMGDISFGQPSRITASIGLGENGVVNVEREADMSGPTHTKGVLILTGYLSQQFAQDKPLSLNARLVFEQNYGGVDGDSASSAELYAILSALAEVPIKQSLAVTGSVNQKGEVQAIGGVNEKIEGYFAVCKVKGLSGDQGVMIPASNVTNLMLKQEVVDAVQAEQFHLWSVATVEEGIEVLTGVPAGKKPDGSFASDGVFERVNQRLLKMAGALAKFNNHVSSV